MPVCACSHQARGQQIMACGSNQAFTSFCKKVLSEHSYSFTYCLWLLHAPLTELSGHNRNVMAWKPYFLSVPLQTTMPLLHLSLCPLWEQVTVIRLLGMYIIWSIVWIDQTVFSQGGSHGTIPQKVFPQKSRASQNLTSLESRCVFNVSYKPCYSSPKQAWSGIEHTILVSSSLSKLLETNYQSSCQVPGTLLSVSHIYPHSIDENIG